ncbi:MAG TPA: hypothetical protein PLN85_01480 [archaeon]|nr:hypothetical protein [archaeon]HRT02632.1 hypothetical protein [Candidatus Diapherotrites archaeon]
MTTRKITVYSTLGQQNVTFDTDVKTWGELSELIYEEIDGIDLKKMIAIESVSKNSFDHPEALLPEEDCIIFLRVRNTDKGVDYSTLTMKELREEVKKFKAIYGQDFVAVLKANGNWTQFTTAKLADVLNQYAFYVSEKQEEIENSNQVLVDKEDISLITRMLKAVATKVDQLLNIKEKKDRSEIEKLDLEAKKLFSKI